MFKFLRKLKGQSTLEYAVLMIIIIGALLSIQTYVKRGVQGRIKSATDDIGDQFSPGNTNYTTTTTVNGTTQQSFNRGVSSQQVIGDEKTTVTSNMTIINNEFEYWGN